MNAPSFSLAPRAVRPAYARAGTNFVRFRGFALRAPARAMQGIRLTAKELAMDSPRASVGAIDLMHRDHRAIEAAFARFDVADEC